MSHQLPMSSRRRPAGKVRALADRNSGDLPPLDRERLLPNVFGDRTRYGMSVFNKPQLDLLVLYPGGSRLLITHTALQAGLTNGMHSSSNLGLPMHASCSAPRISGLLTSHSCFVCHAQMHPVCLRNRTWNPCSSSTSR